MKYFPLFTAAAIACASHSNVQAAGDWLIGGSVIWIENDIDDTVGGLVRVGYNFQSDNQYGFNTDLELEIGYFELPDVFTSGDLVFGGDQEIVPILGNVRVHIPLAGAVGAYVGGGIGYAVVTTDFENAAFGRVKDTNIQYTYTFFAGVSITLSDNAKLIGGYRYQSIDGDDLKKGDRPVFTSNQDYNIFEVGANILF
ncbi:MAG: outer membrane protein [Puniceicoccaceae bacterium]